MPNPFIEKAKRNPFVEKAKRSPSDSVSISDGMVRATSKAQPATPDYDPDGGMVPIEAYDNARRIAERNYRELYALLTRLLEEGNNPEAIERIRLRVEEAREAVQSFR